MTATDHEHFEDLAALCAAGAATPAEERELEAILAGDADARAVYGEYADASTFLAHGLPAITPPATALDQIRGSIARESGRGGRSGLAGDASASAPDKRDLPDNVIDLAARRRRRAPMLVTSVSVVAAAAMSVLWLREKQTTGELRANLATEAQLRKDQSSRMNRQISALTAELGESGKKLAAVEERASFVESPAISLSTIAKGDEGPRVKIFVDNNKRRWLVFAYELPPIPDDKDYQLWFLSPEAPAPVSAGLLHQRPDGTLEAELDLPADLSNIQQAAISLEKKGGVTSPTMDQIKVIGPL